MFPRFDAAMAVDDEHAARLVELGAPGADPLGCLKTAAPSLPVDRALVQQLRRASAGRLIVAVACTHADTEGAVLDATCRPDRLTLIAPRYPDRWTGGPTVPRRSRSGLPGIGQDRWLCDTYGELGSLYAAADVVVLGGAFADHGGHNPAEPARFGKPVVTGPDMRANARTASELRDVGALVQVETLQGLGDAVDRLAADRDDRARRGDAATTLSEAWSERRRTAARRLLSLT